MFLQQREIQFEEINVANNFGNLRLMRRLTASRQVPVCIRDDQVVVGYNVEALKKLIT